MPPNPCALPFAAAFPAAGAYRALSPPPLAVRENDNDRRRFAYRERHLQCLWFDPAFRPAMLATAQGECVHIDDPGRWNPEAGPDFLAAVLRVGPERRRFEGDIEVHVHPSDWDRHGHARDRAYDRVIAHVTWFDGPTRDLPPGVVRIPLCEAVAANPAFSFEAIDTEAYPHAVARVPAPPCADVLAAWPPDRRAAVLDAAGQERLRAKTARMAALIERHGARRALYESMLVALGYKHNRQPCRELARRLSIDRLTDAGDGDPETVYALLLGAAGLLPPPDAPATDDETQRVSRRLWDAWWRRQERLGLVPLTRACWTLHGQRPSNHPARRLAAMAGWFADPAWIDALAATPTAPAANWLQRADRALRAPAAPAYWRYRLRWGGPRRQHAVALVGAGRRAAIIANVFIPYLGAIGLDMAPLLDACPPEDDNAISRETAHRLLGRDHDPALYARGLRRQGLLQIAHDFCLNMPGNCDACPFAHALRQSTDVAGP